MKKTWRLAVAVLALVGLCASLCGCQALEDMKTAQAFWTDDGCVLWNGVEYKPLDGSEALVLRDWMQSVYITQSDVPVLLSEAFGTSGDVYGDGLFIEAGRWETVGAYEDYIFQTYCRADSYDEVAASLVQLNEGNQVFDTYCYEYTVWDEGPMMYEDDLFVLSEEHIAALEATLSEDNMTSWVEEYGMFCTIETRTKDLLFSENAWDVVPLYDPYDPPVSSADERYAVYDSENDRWYIVPTDLTAVFEDMLAPVLASYKQEMMWIEESAW